MRYGRGSVPVKEPEGASIAGCRMHEMGLYESVWSGIEAGSYVNTYRRYIVNGLPTILNWAIIYFRTHRATIADRRCADVCY